MAQDLEIKKFKEMVFDAAFSGILGVIGVAIVCFYMERLCEFFDISGFFYFVLTISGCILFMRFWQWLCCR